MRRGVIARWGSRSQPCRSTSTEATAAFLDALVDLLEDHGDWLYASETGRPQARYTSGAYEAWRAHVAELWVHLRDGRGISAERLRAALRALIPR